MTSSQSGRAIALLRVFFGIVFLANGIAKVTGASMVELGPWTSFLINLDTAKRILTHNAASSVGVYHDFAFSVVLAHWGLFAFVLTAAEIAVGFGLISGMFGRAAAAGGAALALNTQVAAIGAGEWTFEYLVELVPLIALAFLPSHPVPGFGRASSRGRWRRN